MPVYHPQFHSGALKSIASKAVSACGTPIAVLLLATAAFQVSFWGAAQPIHVPDTVSYQEPVARILDGNWSGFYMRTPGYPVFLSVIQGIGGFENYRAVVSAQFLFGSLIPFMLYAIYRPLLPNGWLALFPASVYLLDWLSVGFQSAILTESLTQALLVATVLALRTFARRKRIRTIPLLAALMFATLMVRPSFQLFPWFIVILGCTCDLLFSGESQSRRRTAIWWGGIAITAQLLTWGWSAKLYQENGHSSLSLLTGYALLNHVGPLANQAPAEEFGQVRSCYLDAVRDANGNHINAGFSAGSRLAASTDLSPPDILAEYTDLAVWLVKHYPMEYARSVLRAQDDVWIDSPRYVIEPSALYDYVLTHPVWRLVYGAVDLFYWQRPALLLATPLILTAGIITFLWRKRRDRMASLTGVLIIGTVIYDILIHTAVNNTELGRYRLTVQPLYFSMLAFLIVYACLALRNAFRGRTTAAESVLFRRLRRQSSEPAPNGTK